MNTEDHTMLDVETAATSPNAVMLQIAAVKFNPTTRQVSDSFCRNISIGSSQRLGFEKERSTIDWWKKQKPEVFASVTENAVPAAIVMTQFANWMGLEPGKKHGPVWSHATFDFVIVNAYLRKLALQTMDFRMAMDIRTLTALAQIDLNSYDWGKKTHNALDDCVFQIEYCCDALQKIAN